MEQNNSSHDELRYVLIAMFRYHLRICGAVLTEIADVPTIRTPGQKFNLVSRKYK